MSGQFKLSSSDPFLVVTVKPVSPPSILEIRMDGNMYVMHYDLQMKCTFYDGRWVWPGGRGLHCGGRGLHCGGCGLVSFTISVLHDIVYISSLVGVVCTVVGVAWLIVQYQCCMM